MVIRDIVVDNFKSYAGQHTLGPFHKTFTAVIGPNGSGKSNVIDAMLFVFGKAAKKIRLDKLSQLIHHSALHPNLSYASVAVHFVDVLDDVKDPYQRHVVPGSLLTVSRDVHRATNQSQYYVQGKKVSQKEVVTLLKDRGIDLDHNRFLILQGEVEQIALMKPKGEREGEEGLLEYFDDLIGSNAYASAIKESTTTAEKKQEDRLASLDALRRVETDLTALEAAKVSTIEFVTKDNHLQQIMSVLCQLKLADLEDNLIEPRKKQAVLDSAVAAANGVVAEVTRKAAEAAKAAKDATKSAVVAAANEEAAQREKDKAEGATNELKADVEDIDKQRRRDTDKLRKGQEDLRKLQTTVDDARRDQEVCTRQLTDAESELEGVTPSFETASEKVQETCRPLRKQLEDKRRSLAPFETALAAAVETLRTAEDQLATMTSTLDKRTRELSSMEKRREECVKTVSVMSNSLRECTESHDSVTREVQALEAQIAESVAKKSQCSSQIEQIKHELREGESDDKVVQFLVAQKSLKGYYGTLRQLGSIDERYDIAAGVLGTGNWAFHVVDNDQTASDAIKLLRENDLGRGTFVALSRVAQQYAAKYRAEFHAPMGSHRLLDLIQCEKKFAPAFYFAVRDSLVTDTLSRARELGLGNDPHGRHRVATLAGELVEPGGTVIGGGAAPQGARLRGAHVRVDKTKAREQLTDLQATLVAALESERALNQELHAKTSRHPSASQHHQHVDAMRREIDVAQQELVTLDGRIANSKSTIHRLKNDATSAGEWIRLKSVVDAASSARDAAEKQQLRAQVAVRDIEAQLEAAGGPEYLELKRRVEALRDKTKQLQSKVHELGKTLQKASVALERKQADVAELQQKVDNPTASAEMLAKKQTLEKLQELLTSKIVTLRDASDTKARADSNLSDAKKAVEKLSDDLRHAKQAAEDAERQLEEHLNDLKPKLEELAKFESKIDACDLKIRANVTDFGIETLARLERGSNHPANEGGNISSHLSDIDMATFTTRVAPLETLRNSYDMEHSTYMARQLNQEVKDLRDTVDLHCVQRWREKDLECRQMRDAYQTLLNDVAAAEATLERLKAERRHKFLSVFHSIQHKLREMYRLLTGGGDAEIELVDTADPFEGINYVVRPPKKSWKVVSNLSGGEKTLASLALVFALHHVKPTPVYVLDEIDAALDFRNVSIVARYVLERAVGAQFIIISLRNNMFELAHQLVGISKVRDVTQSIALSPALLAKRINEMIVTQHQQRAMTAVTAAATVGSTGGAGSRTQVAASASTTGGRSASGVVGHQPRPRSGAENLSPTAPVAARSHSAATPNGVGAKRPRTPSDAATPS